MSDLLLSRSAVISPCETWRYRIDQDVQDAGPVYAYFGINGSTADGEKSDHTDRKWFGFTLRFGGRKYIVGNPFGYRATDVKKLATASDPIGPDNARHLREIIAEADILIPCWGNRSKVPPRLRRYIDELRDQIFAAGKPVRVFGFTLSGDPMHPLTLGYDTPLVDWAR